MSVADAALVAALTVLWVGYLAAMFRPLEAVFPARPQALMRREWATDLCFLLGQFLVFTSLVHGALAATRPWLDAAVPGALRRAVASQPWWLQAVEIVVLTDALVYWGHRLQHRVDVLWRFHSVHHSARTLDWLAAHREHPLDSLWTIGILVLPAYALGFPLETIAPLAAFRGLWAVFIHSNVRLPVGPLRVLIGAPELHRWHHARDRDAGNYGNLCPWLDVLFGTYRCPDGDPHAYGIDEPVARTYAGHLVGPLLPR